ncbi:hypothetical protein [Sphaerisporangium sp. NPDC051011]|uniref:hypothetical protein n=1 Tax=Sphaerisporangium sp. NPDC051011 TaxID=3155792 RepID=UPI0033D17927
MILTSTYRDQTTLSRDLLAAYSPLDHATTATLPPEQVDAAFERLLRRLAVLAALHGAHTPAAFLSALADTAQDAGDVDVVDLAAAFLEDGTPHLAAGPSEIQQELVHFSRIVDIGHLGLGGGIDEHALRRLRGSDRLPDSLKVLSELVVVTRARLTQRGRTLPTPCLRQSHPAESDAAADLTTAAPTSSPDYWMAVRCPRRRIRRQVRHELSMLLAYLTPAEAALALWAHAHEQQLPARIELVVAQSDAPGHATIVRWDYQPGTPAVADEVIGRVARQLPTITTASDGETTQVDLGDDAYRLRIAGDGTTILTGDGTTAALLTPPPQGRQAAPAEMAVRARQLLSGYTGPDLVSIESGHIHLDRDLDIDQDTGTAIGHALVDLLAGRQQRPPVLTPMMDDDHVLVRLTPDHYRTWLRRTFGAAPMHLICESSPIIRSIVVALYQRMNNSRLADRYQRRGGNLFLALGDGSHCEVFEGIDGQAPITGCVMFETALLIYRTAPARFDRYFTDRYHLTDGVHDHAAAILSTGQPHDTKMAALAGYYAIFGDVTDPHRPDRHITALVNDVLDQAGPVTAHLNVLEDYYEVQQRRVRALLNLLGLPLRLVTVHFNTATGRLVLCDE